MAGKGGGPLPANINNSKFNLTENHHRWTCLEHYLDEVCFLSWLLSLLPQFFFTIGLRKGFSLFKFSVGAHGLYAIQDCQKWVNCTIKVFPEIGSSQSMCHTEL